jgi:hypothetical protein
MTSKEGKKSVQERNIVDVKEKERKKNLTVTCRMDVK